MFGIPNITSTAPLNAASSSSAKGGDLYGPTTKFGNVSFPNFGGGSGVLILAAIVGGLGFLAWRVLR